MAGAERSLPLPRHEPLADAGLTVWLGDLERRHRELAARVEDARRELRDVEAGAAVPEALQLQLGCVILEARSRLAHDWDAARAQATDRRAAAERSARRLLAVAADEAALLRAMATAVRSAPLGLGDAVAGRAPTSAPLPSAADASVPAATASAVLDAVAG